MTRSAIALREKLLDQEQFANNPVFAREIRNATDDAISENPDNVPDSRGFHIALAILGVTVIVSAVGVLIITYYNYTHNAGGDVKVPELVAALGTTAIGAVAGLVVSPTVKS